MAATGKGKGLYRLWILVALASVYAAWAIGRHYFKTEAEGPIRGSGRIEGVLELGFGILLKGADLTIFWPQFLGLILLGSLIFLLGTFRFRRSFG